MDIVIRRASFVKIPKHKIMVCKHSPGSFAPHLIGLLVYSSTITGTFCPILPRLLVNTALLIVGQNVHNREDNYANIPLQNNNSIYD